MKTRIPTLSADQPRSADSTQRTQPGSGKPQPPVQHLRPWRALVRYVVVALIALLGFHLNARADSTLVEWGDANSAYPFVPPYLTDVPPDLTNVVAVAAGGDCSLAINGDGAVVAWRCDSSTVPSGLTNVLAVAVGWNHSLALKSDGTVIAWGDNSYGQTNVPCGLSNVVAVAAGGDYNNPWLPGWGHSLALKGDGTIVAWGNNSHGQTNVPSNLPNVVAVAVGAAHSLALTSAGTVVAWGDNFYGQTDVPQNLSNVVAVAAGGWRLAQLSAQGRWDGRRVGRQLLRPDQCSSRLDQRGSGGGA